MLFFGDASKVLCVMYMFCLKNIIWIVLILMIVIFG